METNRGLFLVLLIFLLLFTPAGNPPHLTTPSERSQLNLYLELQRNETDILQNSTYRHTLGNITGITHPANESSFIPSSIEKLAKALWYSESEQDLIGKQIKRPIEADEPNSHSIQATNLVFYSNFSGLFYGFWDKPTHSVLAGLVPRQMEIPKIFKQQPQDLQGSSDTNDTLESDMVHHYHSQLPTMEKVLSSTVDGNITESEGSISVSIEEAIPRNFYGTNVTLITMRISISDTEESSQYTLSLKGLHIKPTGNIVLTTNSLKYSGLQYLPHLILEKAYFDESKELMLQYLNNTLSKYEDEDDYIVFEDNDVASESCEFVLYGHFHSVPLTRDQLRDIEQEIENPVGRPLRPIPAMQLSSIIYSPDCALSVQFRDSRGEKYEQYWSRIRVVVVVGVLLIIAQTFLIAIQMRDTNTPPFLCKVSFYTIAMHSVIDGSVWMASFASSFVEDLTLSFMAIAFLSFALTSMFEMRYLVKIYQAHLSEQQADVRVRDVLANGNGTATFSVLRDGSLVSSAAQPQPETGTALLPVREPATTAPATQDEDLSERAIGSKIYSWFYFALIGFISSALIAATWPIYYRRIYEFVIILGFYSMWVPQIKRNISRGFRRSFLWKFIIGSSIIRLIPVLYFTLDRKNILRHHYDPTLALATTAWLAVQIVILYAQYVFSPRFFLPKGYLPVLYDYHPILTQGDDIESGINLSDSTAPATNDGPSSPLSGTPPGNSAERPAVNCAICMEPIELVITPKSANTFVSSPAILLARQKYMVTPCRHVFHTNCMENQMRFQLKCPVCRNPLPPV